MKVLVFGSSGHIVYGVTRSETKAKQLAADEIFPIIGEPTDTQAWAHLIPTIDCRHRSPRRNRRSTHYRTDPFSTLSLSLLNPLVPPVHPKSPSSTPPASGYTVRVQMKFVSDTTPLSNPVPLIAWRPHVEQVVLRHDRINGIVIRPALLFGKGGSLFEPVFEAAETGRQVAWYGKPGGRFSLIHADDLADVYVRAVEKAPILGGLAIDAGNETTEPIDDFLQRLIQVSGAKGPHGWIEPTNPFEEALSVTVLLRPYLAKSLLGWQKKKPGLTEGLSLYYAAWKASRNEQPQEKLFTATHERRALAHRATPTR
ncbi:hypothetical protein J3R83DRAFT_5689 [Lanmaoa asiatica]|nr:hypothetical protein J3R83DRAFT_5689 [Lanmaoa asiatica]